MNLRLRLTLLLTSIFVITLGVGAGYVMKNARAAVTDELLSSLDLASSLIGLMVAQEASETSAPDPVRLARQLTGLGHPRHLHIELSSSPEALVLALPAAGGNRARAPDWFIRTIEPDRLDLLRSVRVPNSGLHVIVRADPAAEISEVWSETRLMLGVLVAFGVVAVALVSLVVGRALRPLYAVAAALERVERGEYASRVAGSGSSEVDAIAERFNHMASVLERSHREMTALATRSLAIQEEERRNLAHELHDEMGQSISAIKALAVSIGQRAPAADGTLATSAATIANVCTDVYDRVRHMMMRLRPIILDELGLVTALQNMIDDWNGHHEETFCRFDVTGRVPSLSPETSINLFRIVQEALTNIARHARATEAAIVLAVEPLASGRAKLRLRISDNGVGFDVDRIARGLGLVGIAERARAIGGTLSLASRAGAGTQFELDLILEPESPA
ncbi:MAG: HAMP domain-containing protein [Gammaproteobacteria bacterium]|nr:HAMP domain-containing protein [Gammaproteobacteria bacterium]